MNRPDPRRPPRPEPDPRRRAARRRGAFTALTAASLVAVLAFVALGVDVSLISLTRSRMQASVDAAALAAAQELSDTVADADDAAALDAEMASRGKAMADKVARLNETYIDPDRDVRFGRRVFEERAGASRVLWGVAPYNVVEVSARRDNPDTSAPDGQMPAFFSRIFGMTGHSFEVSAVAYVEPRDLVLVLDYSGSMNDDSELPAFGRLGEAPVTENMLEIYDALDLDPGLLPTVPEYATLHGVPRDSRNQIPHVTLTPTPWGGTVTSTHKIDRVWVKDGYGNWRNHDHVGKSHTFSTSTHRIAEVRVKSWKNDRRFGRYGERIVFDAQSTREALGLDGVDYPFPGGGWDDYFSFAENTYTSYDAGQLMKYGKPGLVSYILAYQTREDQTPPLWKAPAHPFHAMKEGVTQLTEYLEALRYGDHLGLVSYDTEARREVRVNDPANGMVVDISADPITDDYAAVDMIQRHRQAGYYLQTTGLGGRREGGPTDARPARPVRGPPDDSGDDRRERERQPRGVRAAARLGLGRTDRLRRRRHGGLCDRRREQAVRVLPRPRVDPRGGDGAHDERRRRGRRRPDVRRGPRRRRGAHRRARRPRRRGQRSVIGRGLPPDRRPRPAPAADARPGVRGEVESDE